MDINPSYTTIGKIFESNFLFEVPKYQRYYAWESEQVDDFISDIEKMFKTKGCATMPHHFFGGIVCVDKKVPGSNRKQEVLIDGQQRITTTILLINNIIIAYNDMLSKYAEAKELIEGRIAKLKSQYLLYRDEINMKIEWIDKLVLSDADKDFFKGILEGGMADVDRSSHERLQKADASIKKFIRELMKNCNNEQEKLETLKYLEDLVNVSFYIIFITADTKEAAYKLFQVLNDRGIGLTEGDLLKSKTLEALETPSFATQQHMIQQSWDAILGDTPERISDFFKRYYSSVTGMRVGRASMYDDLLAEFFPSIKNIDTVSALEEANQIVATINAMKRDKEVYNKITAGEWLYDVVLPVKTWDRNRLFVLTNYLGYDNVIPLLMAASLLKQTDFAKIVFSLEKFMFRYKGICNNNVQNLSDLFMKESKLIRDNANGYRIGSILGKLETMLKQDADDEKFKQNIKYLKYRPKSANKNLKYFFTILSEHYSWYASGATTSLNLSDLPVLPYDAATIEHLYPQNPETEDVAFNDVDIHSIGNLSILTGAENERVKNKLFTEKKDKIIDSTYSLNQYFRDKTEWSSETIKTWEEYICNMACRVFTI